ncbi:hypothetical protein B9Q11_01525 [Candidatus Marsarchaeota G2 archaeon ECH_B_SAG-F08]|jgi:hypothetical protein|uniref:Uncharacterized protein n=6 Tax=Candidatus Marsarchaeota TaxID=1978152 RepID=A0A2R6C1G0_9ARCH|nr:MAG: hypothetical protein B9Q02_00400 [Candidatus Marsarchaeota G1 archaeon BE_D]PSN89560.1 MAG: hypothetical protein B9Q00_00800 [Candidatus Marsarchaeota G1 archaeon OSP_C]PSN94009.1 MAG: hypothetical protein B9P99_02000 [Candidatus Marsarchaeota G1 archaeon OSP_B]PSN98922.1 MAG: hypothetical protein B9Q11_01525 [Candidatus Marsarchaeota G2 archaeon ECH_B_SAG-F08]PSO03687.1 MAG: hypothetical protein B9Q10_00070 [Candidatus Marsarchaeota G2 archaeon ECH_B_SAG-E12]PSO04596.1 MAG: hypothetic
MGLIDKISEFYDNVTHILSAITQYVLIIAMIALLSGGLFVIITQPPMEGGTPTGGVAILAATPSYQFGIELYVVGTILGLFSIGIIALLRAPNIYGQKRYATSLAAFGILCLIIGIVSMIYLGIAKLHG